MACATMHLLRRPASVSFEQLAPALTTEAVFSIGKIRSEGRSRSEARSSISAPTYADIPMSAATLDRNTAQLPAERTEPAELDPADLGHVHRNFVAVQPHEA
jgi:hypothetical protein